METLKDLVGRESAQAIQEIVQNASSKPESGIFSSVLGVLILLVGAGGVVGQLQTSQIRFEGVAPMAGQGIWGFVRQRFISFAMVLAIGFLLVVSLAASALIDDIHAIHESFARHDSISRPRLSIWSFHLFLLRRSLR